VTALPRDSGSAESDGRAELQARMPPADDSNADTILDAFVAWVNDRGLTLYSAQEEAILELLSGKHVVLNTPTGSGKSLVATALLFRALSRSTRFRSRRSRARSSSSCARCSERKTSAC
jgi:ATP-dependent helicase YprA (DUF1998 family)